MADVKPLKLVDQGGGAGRLEEFGAADKVPAENLPATEWASETVSQAEAEAGTATDRRAWTAQRVAQAVRGAVLTGLSTASAAAVTATDSVLGAMGKLQAQISGLSTSKLDANANAVSATKLQTARTINGVAFDGTANVNVADSTKVPLTGATGAALIPAGTEAQRPASPVNGCFRYNSETNQFEGYQDGEWGQVGGGQEGGGLPLFSVMWWPQRSAIPAGFVAADGQELARLTYPDAWAGIQAGNVPTVADATWNSTPTERGKFTTGDGATTFRLPDYNGKFAGSLGAVFLRGDGALSAGQAGLIQKDQLGPMRYINNALNSTTNVYISNGVSGLGATLTRNGPGTIQAAPVDAAPDGTRWITNTGNETRPLNVTGCWVIKLFGAVVNVGSADAAQLASDYANLAGRVSTLESIGKPFTKEYASAPQALSVGGLITLAHGLGELPRLVRCELHCIGAEHGYSAGDVIDAPQDSQDLGSSDGLSVRRNSTQIIIRQGTTGGLVILNSAGTTARISNSLWQLVVRAWA